MTAETGDKPPDKSTFTHVEDLLYYDGPLLIHWKDPQGRDWLECWFGPELPGTGRCGDWFWLWLRTESMEGFLANTVKYYDMFKTASEMWLYRESTESFERKTFEQLDPKSLPDRDVFLEPTPEDKNEAGNS